MTRVRRETQTHCHRGHPMSGSNLYVYKGGKACKACRNLLKASMRKAGRSGLKEIDDERAACILAAAEQGHTLNKICGGRSKKTGTSVILTDRIRFRQYCDSHPAFAAQINPLLARNTELMNTRKGDHKRNMTHCRRGHPLSDGAVYFDRDGSHRKCKICTAINAENPPLPTSDQINRVTAALNAGQSISQICWGQRRAKDAGEAIVSFRKLKRYRLENPEYDRFVCSVIAGSNSRAQQRRHRPQLVRSTAVRSEINEYHAVAGLVPANLPPEVRDDIIQSIFIALLEGTLRRDQVQGRVRQFVTAHNREANKHGVGQFGLVSLDAPIFSDSATTRGDLITHGLWE